MGAVEQEQVLTEIQKQIIALRQEFKQRIEKAEEDRRALHQDLHQKFSTLSETQSTLTISQPVIQKLEKFVVFLEKYEIQIDLLEQAFDTMETTMNATLDDIEAQLVAVREHGIQRPSISSVAVPTEPGEAEPTETEPEEESPSLNFAPGQLFRAAYRMYMDGEYEIAIAGFQKFLQEYSDSQLVGAAQYWIAESLVKLEEYEIAIQEYERLIKTYPQNDKIPDTHYGIGVALLKLGRADEAKLKFQYVNDHFAGTVAARKAQNRLEEFR